LFLGYLIKPNQTKGLRAFIHKIRLIDLKLAFRDGDTMATQARSIASLTISFGLVAIPVKLYSATVSSERISFNLLRQKDGSRVKQQYIAVNDGKPVERSEMVKGYEFAKDQYVMFSPDELKALEDTTSHSIDIGQFVPLESVDPVYFDGTYYLAPDKGGAKPYTLLATALRKAQQCAVGRWISRGKEHIVVIRPIEDGLALHQLHFKAEVRELKDLGIDAAPVSDPELKLAQQLIDHLAVKRFDPNEYMDEHRARVQAAIQKKVEGKEVSLAEGPVSSKGSNVIDLMEALRASIDARGDARSDARAAPTASKAAPAAVPDLKERKAPKRAAAASSSRKTARR
jgi:DNA end-binding protein Ku